MPDCECLAACPFFNDKMANMPSMAGIYKNKYCKDDFESCARYIVFKTLGKGTVPADLFPNQLSRAEELVKGK
ncbi:hypothetical protein HZA73_01055 [candidate division TA06 bacterium]|nr:hypothetical protein [candidate division TA06 bacterium]